MYVRLHKSGITSTVNSLCSLLCFHCCCFIIFICVLRSGIKKFSLYRAHTSSATASAIEKHKSIKNSCTVMGTPPEFWTFDVVKLRKSKVNSVLNEKLLSRSFNHWLFNVGTSLSFHLLVSFLIKLEITAGLL